MPAAASFTVMPSAAVVAAFVIMAVLMVMIAGGFGIPDQRAGNKRLYRLVRTAGNAGIQLDAGLRKSCSRSAADTSANKDVGLRLP